MNAKQNVRRRASETINNRMRSCSAVIALAAAGVVAGLSSRPAHAATYIFDPLLNPSGGSDGSNNWDASTTADWYQVSSGALTTWSNSNADTAVFGSGGTAGTVAVSAVNVGTLAFNSVGGSYTLTGGTITFGSPGTITTSSGVSATVGSSIAGGAMTFNGGGNLTLTGAVSYTGATVINGGTVSYTGSASSTGDGTLDVGNAVGSTTVLNLSSTGSYNFSGGANVSDSATNSAAINLTSGTLNLENPSGSYVSIGNGGYASLLMSGNSALNVGTSANSTGLRVGTGSTTAIGVFTQTGGTVVLQRYLAIANSGFGVATLSGGTITVNVTRSLVGDSANGTSVLNLGTEAGGSNTFSTVFGLELEDAASSSGSSTTNLNAGTLILGGTGIYQGVVPTGTAKVSLNLNGATIVDSSTATVIQSADGLTANVFNGGAIFNVSGAGIIDTVAAPLLATTGGGIYKNTAFAPTAGTLGTGYIGAPEVTVSGGSGTGATAIANVANGSITGFIITNPGQGYQTGDQLSFALAGGGATSAASGDTYTLQSGDVVANGAGGLTKLGTGTLLLTGANTYTGPTTISGGILQVNPGGTLGSTSSVSIASGSLLTINTTSAINIPGPISGLGGFSQIAAGKTTFNGASTYSGATTISSGSLILASGASLGNTAITAASGTSFFAQSSTGSITIGSGSASLSLAAGSTLSMADGAIETLHLVNTAGMTALTFGTANSSTNTNLTFDLGQTTVDNIAVTGNASVLSPVSISINALSSDTTLIPGNYTLISAGAGLGSNFTLATTNVVVNNTGYALNLNSSSGTAEVLSVVQTGGVIGNAYWAGAINGVWNTANSNATNWRTDATSNTDTGIIPSSVTNVFFTTSNPVAGNLSTSLASNYSINSLTFNGNATGNVSISGYTLTINALGISGNTAGNGITVASGATTNTINSNVVLGSSQTWTNNSTNPLIVTGAVSGSASLTQAGTGPVVLSGSNTYTGGYTLTSGSLAINSPTALGTGTFTISGSPTIDNTSGAPIAMTANNPQAWNSNFTFAGTSNLNMGSGAVTMNASRTVTLSAGNLTVGAVGDGGFGYGLTVAGNGNLNMAGVNTYSGATVVTGGSLSFIGAGGSTNTTSLDVSPAAGQTGVVNFNTSGTASFNGNVTVADISDAIGAINVINGTVSVPAAGSINYVTIGNGGYGALNISGGSFTAGSVATSSGIRIGGGTTSGVGFLTQSGGTLTTYRYLAIGNQGYGQATFTGGTTNNIGYRTIVGDGSGPAIMNLGTQAGGTSMFITGGNGGLIVDGTGTANATLNLNAGTLNLSSGSIYASSGTGTNAVNLNGATILAGTNGLTLISNTITGANVYNGGANFNVPSGFTSTVAANLAATTGNGIYAEGSGGTFAVTGNSSVGYVGTPAVASITGGNGTGAMGVSDLTNGVITGVTITNPGQGYQVGDNLTFTFSDGGYNTTASPFNYTLTAADVAQNNGGMTKTGGGSLIVTGANTYTGNTLVKGGTLVVANPSALGTGTAVLSSGTTLALSSITAGSSFSNFTLNSNGVFTPVVGGNGTTLTLTSANIQEATSAFNPTPVTITDSTGFVASFTYTHIATGGYEGAADGVVFVIQNSGTNALGQTGGAQGYTGTNNVSTGGIANSVAAGINLYQDSLEAGGGGVFNNSTGADSVPFISAYGSSNVTIVYNGQTDTLTETITSNVNGSSYSLVTTGVDVAALLGGTPGGSGTGYVGFTGGTGAVDDSQTISNFTFGTTAMSLSSTAVSITNGVTVNPASAATIQLSPTANYSYGSVGPITIGTGGTLAVSIGSNAATGVTHGVLATPSITFANSSSGTLDVANNALDITSQTLATVTAMVASAYSNGTWTGPGITSSTAAMNTTHLTALGVIVNDNGSGTPLYGTGGAIASTFDGTTPADGDILVKYTFYGDANLDGKVDGSDYTRIDNGNLLGLTGWYNGDFNYDGVINGSDYTLIDNAYNTQGASLAAEVAASTAQIAGAGTGATSAVPEPTAIGFVAAAMFGMLGRRRRRSN